VGSRKPRRAPLIFSTLLVCTLDRKFRIKLNMDLKKKKKKAKAFIKDPRGVVWNYNLNATSYLALSLYSLL
jgi:hypothetical protein